MSLGSTLGPAPLPPSGLLLSLPARLPASLPTCLLCWNCYFALCSCRLHASLHLSSPPPLGHRLLVVSRIHSCLLHLLRFLRPLACNPPRAYAHAHSTRSPLLSSTPPPSDTPSSRSDAVRCLYDIRIYTVAILAKCHPHSPFGFSLRFFWVRVRVGSCARLCVG